ncbi:XBAT34 [Symbiodinium natans]|uniref:XBAT34 protein n=1 Tax=Symbiodinium natans TaxID=878477 RepID=A0A812SZ05_9DINO|nr:XBAT34 [Symbiodinium natans]
MDADPVPLGRLTAAIAAYEDVGGHVEYCLKVTHCSGISWTTWRRFSDFHHAHEELSSLVDSRDLPPGPERSWIPAFTQSLSADFCEQREQELNTYLQRVLQGQGAALPAPLRRLLGLRRPEPPGSLRVVPNKGRGQLELEVKPPEAMTFEERQSQRRMELGGPVDGYYIEVVNLDSGGKHRLTRDVGASGTLPQKAQVGHLDSGRHTFAVAAYNGAGCSGQVSITVDPSLAFATPWEVWHGAGPGTVSALPHPAYSSARAAHAGPQWAPQPQQAAPVQPVQASPWPKLPRPTPVAFRPIPVALARASEAMGPQPLPKFPTRSCEFVLFVIYVQVFRS